MQKLPVLIIISLFLLVTAKPAFAADCTIIYGGGQTECVKRESPTPTPAPTKIVASNSQTTKGGLPIYEGTKADTAPATGPEALSLISLIPIAAAGFWFRQKAK